MSGPLRARAWDWWDRYHTKLGWTTLGVLLGGLAAALVTSAATACGGETACSVSWEAVEAVGTWFGAVGGLLAVGAAIATLRSGDQARLAEQRRQAMTAQERETQAQAAAARIQASVGMRSWSGNTLNMLQLNITNGNTTVSAYHVEVEVDLDFLGEGSGRVNLGRIQTLPANRTEPVTVPFASRQASPGLQVVPEVSPSAQPEWFAQLVESCTLTYVIDEMRWRRHGSQAPERCGPA